MSQLVCAEAEEIIAQCQEMFISMFDESYPYIIPLNFVYMQDFLYFHTGNVGKKVNLLDKNPNVAFSMCTEVQIISELATTYFKSVVGTAKAIVVEDYEEKVLALAKISQRYSSNCQIPSPPNKVAKTKIIKLEINNLSYRNKQKIGR